MQFAKILEYAKKELSYSGDQVVMPIVKNYYTSLTKSPQFRPGFRVSSLSKMCCSEEVFQRLLPRAGKPVTVGLQAIFETGTALHTHWQNAILGPAGVLEGWWHCTSCEFKVEGIMPLDICPSCKVLKRCNSCKKKLEHGRYSEKHNCPDCQQLSWYYEEYGFRCDELDIEGHCDGVLTIGSTKYIWEFKTINDMGFTNRVPTRPLPEHIAQVQIYMWLRNIKKAVIHYLNKNTSEEREFIIEYDDNFRKDIYNKIGIVNRCVEKKELPSHMVCHKKTQVRAKRCLWAKECFDRELAYKLLRPKTNTQT